MPDGIFKKFADTALPQVTKCPKQSLCQAANAAPELSNHYFSKWESQVSILPHRLAVDLLLWRIQTFSWNVSWIWILCRCLCWNVLCVCSPSPTKIGCLYKLSVREFPAVSGLCGKVLVVDGCTMRSRNSHPVLGKFTFAILTLEIMNLTLPAFLLAPLKSP